MIGEPAARGRSLRSAGGHHVHMVALCTCWYNFVKMHRTLAITPGVIDTLWSMTDLVTLVDEFDDAQPRKKAGRKSKPSA